MNHENSPKSPWISIFCALAFVCGCQGGVLHTSAHNDAAVTLIDSSIVDGGADSGPLRSDAAVQTDAGTEDAGNLDATTPDAGSIDAGPDAAPRAIECGAPGSYEFPLGSGSCIADPCLPDPCGGVGSCSNDTGVASCNACTYFVDALGGLDSNSGTSSSNAWQSVTRVNMTTLHPGDNVCFKRGQRFYGAIEIRQSGTEGNPISFSAFGAGDDPVISGLTPVASWIDRGGNIWESARAVSTLPYTNLVTFNGTNTPMGRTPNTGLFHYQSHADTTTITSSDLTGDTNWTGAELAMFVTTYGVSRFPITAQSGTTLTYNRNSVAEPVQHDDQGFTIQNDPRTLDAQNEWYFDPSAKTLKVFSVGAPTNVEVATLESLVTSDGSGYGYIRFSDLAFRGANSATVELRNMNHVTIDLCDFNLAGRDAIFGPREGDSTGLTVTRSAFNNTNNDSITISRSFTNAIIRSNYIQNSGLIFGMGANSSGEIGTGSYGGIYVDGANALVELNTIKHVGYNAIAFFHTPTTVQKNFIDGFCELLTDGGGIYTWNGNDSGRTEDNHILNNVVMNGATDNGIYLDLLTNGTEVAGNSVANNYVGILVTESLHDVVFRNNTAYNNSFAQIMLNSTSVPLLRFDIHDNFFVSRDPDQRAIWANHVETMVFTADNNTYARPINDATPMAYYYNAWLNESVASWKVRTGQDVHSHGAPHSIADLSDLRFEYNETPATKTVALETDYVDMNGVVYSASVSLLPFTSLVLLKR